MDKNRIKGILYRYRVGISNAQEKKAVDVWYEKIQNDKEISLDESEIAETGVRILDKLSQHINPKIQLPRKKHNWIGIIGATVAASILLFFVLFIMLRNETPLILAGTQKASLTLPNGDVIDLNALSKDKAVLLNGIRLRKTTNGEIAYEAMPGIKAIEMGQNVLNVPKGGKFNIILPDSSRVQLNSDSKLSYPAVFEGNQRVVYLKGEAFFEISHNVDKAFIVKTDRADIRVLGTKFNVQAYPNENVWETTVEQGSVRVSNTIGSTTLKKGDQAQIDVSGNIATNKSVEENTSWTKGYFRFTNNDIYTVARQIERWYNIPVEVDPRLEKLEFYGLITKQETANNLFEILEETNTIKAKITKSKITILPKNN